tara:strand:- start:240 stop:1025 length:786 start_codon:yes stop_codon:yes gene_type:complete
LHHHDEYEYCDEQIKVHLLQVSLKKNLNKFKIMLRSEPNAICCIWKPCINKITLTNESNFKVKYEAYPYKGGAVGKIDAAIGAGGFEGKTALEIIQAENLKPEVGVIPKNDVRHVTVNRGQKIAVRYMYLDLHDDYTEEVRNFGVLDLVKFVQPPQEDIDEILTKKEEALEEVKRKEAEEQRKVEEERKKREREEKERKEKEEREERERIERERKCSSVTQHMCSPSDTPKKLCPHCNHWYCIYHYRVNNNPIGRGGHVCN